MKLIVWGIGHRGKRLYEILPSGTILAYIDSNKNLINQTYNEIPIISFEDYKEFYSEYYILISPLKAEDIVIKLESNYIDKYRVLYNEPPDLYRTDGMNINDIFAEIFTLNKKYLMMGNNVYTVLLYEFMKKKYRSVQGLVNNYEEESILNSTGECLHIDKIEFDEFDELLFGHSADYIRLSEQVSKKIMCTDATDNMKKIMKHFNMKLREFKNLNRNKRCFIVANGPSLEIDDLNRIVENTEISFGVNYIYKTNKETEWRPDYYVVADTFFADTEYEEIIRYNAKLKFVLDSAKIFWEQVLPENIYRYHNAEYRALNNTRQISKVSEDICYGIYASNTVIHVCMQIAMYMGINEIILIGADTTSYDSQVKAHFTEDYYSDKIRCVLKEPYLDVERVINGYKDIKAYADLLGIKIYNATRGGELEVFERREIEYFFR